MALRDLSLGGTDDDVVIRCHSQEFSVSKAEVSQQSTLLSMVSTSRLPRWPKQAEKLPRQSLVLIRQLIATRLECHQSPQR